MANGVLLMGWNRPLPGREQQAMDLFQKALAYYEKAKSEGKIESFETVILNAHGGDLNGFILVTGDAEKLSAFKREDTFADYATEAGYCLDDFGIVEGQIGEGAMNQISRWSKLIGR